jgi:hypothetical protein
MNDTDGQDEIIPDRLIAMISLAAGGAWLLQLAFTEGLVRAILSGLGEGPGRLYFSSVNYLLPLPALVLFFFCKRPGWFLVAFYLLQCLNRYFLLLVSPGFRYMSVFEKIFPISWCVFYLVMLVLLAKPSVLHSFRLKGRSAALLLALIMLFTGLLNVFL